MRGDVFLRVETKQVLIAAGAVMQKATQRIQEPRGGREAGGSRRIRIPQLPQPPDQVQVAQSAGCFFYVRLQVVDGLLVFVVARTGQPGQVLGQRAGAALEKRRQLQLQLGVQIARTAQQPPIQKTDVQLDILLVELSAFLNGADGVAQPQPAVP